MFVQLTKSGTTDDNGNKLDSHISDKYYLTCKKLGMKLT